MNTAYCLSSLIKHGYFTKVVLVEKRFNSVQEDPKDKYLSAVPRMATNDKPSKVILMHIQV